MSLIDSKIQTISHILKNEKLQNYAGNSFKKIIKAVMSGDIASLSDTAEDVLGHLLNFPSYIFWDKAQRFLLGTFSDFDIQINFSTKLDKTTLGYEKNVKRVIHLINQIDDDLKIDYFSNLTICFSNTALEGELYYKLAKYLCTCTVYELEFLQSASPKTHFQNNAMISSLYQYGLFSQSSDSRGEIYYELSGMALALKQNCLNFDKGSCGKEEILSYNDVKPINIVEQQTWKTLASKSKTEEIVFNGGKAAK